MSTDKLIITNFTDPLCTLCWDTEPVLRTLETYYNGKIEFRYIMGGLVENINDFSDKYPSSYPQCIAYKAALLMDKPKADKLLRRIREATATENLLTSHEDVLISLAEEVGLDVRQFTTHLHDGSAEQALQGDLALTRALKISDFPSFLIKYNSQQVMVRGYKDFDTFVSVISSITYDRMTPVNPEVSDEKLLAFLDLHPRLTAEEIRMAYNLVSLSDVDEWVKRLKREGKVVVIPAGNSYFVSKKG